MSLYQKVDTEYVDYVMREDILWQVAEMNRPTITAIFKNPGEDDWRFEMEFF